mgnify:CR=1
HFFMSVIGNRAKLLKDMAHPTGFEPVIPGFVAGALSSLATGAWVAHYLEELPEAQHISCPLAETAAYMLKYRLRLEYSIEER